MNLGFDQVMGRLSAGYVDVATTINTRLAAINNLKEAAARDLQLFSLAMEYFTSHPEDSVENFITTLTGDDAERYQDIQHAVYLINGYEISGDKFIRSIFQCARRLNGNDPESAITQVVTMNNGSSITYGELVDSLGDRFNTMSILETAASSTDKSSVEFLSLVSMYNPANVRNDLTSMIVKVWENTDTQTDSNELSVSLQRLAALQSIMIGNDDLVQDSTDQRVYLSFGIEGYSFTSVTDAVLSYISINIPDLISWVTLPSQVAKWAFKSALGIIDSVFDGLSWIGNKILGLVAPDYFVDLGGDLTLTIANPLCNGEISLSDSDSLPSFLKIPTIQKSITSWINRYSDQTGKTSADIPELLNRLFGNVYNFSTMGDSAMLAVSSLLSNTIERNRTFIVDFGYAIVIGYIYRHPEFFDVFRFAIYPKLVPLYSGDPGLSKIGTSWYARPCAPSEDDGNHGFWHYASGFFGDTTYSFNSDDLDQGYSLERSVIGLALVATLPLFDGAGMNNNMNNSSLYDVWSANESISKWIRYSVPTLKRGLLNTFAYENRDLENRWPYYDFIRSDAKSDHDSFNSMQYFAFNNGLTLDVNTKGWKNLDSAKFMRSSVPKLLSLDTIVKFDTQPSYSIMNESKLISESLQYWIAFMALCAMSSTNKQNLPSITTDVGEPCATLPCYYSDNAPEFRYILTNDEYLLNYVSGAIKISKMIVASAFALKFILIARSSLLLIQAKLNAAKFAAFTTLSAAMASGADNIDDLAKTYRKSAIKSNVIDGLLTAIGFSSATAAVSNIVPSTNESTLDLIYRSIVG